MNRIRYRTRVGVVREIGDVFAEDTAMRHRHKHTGKPLTLRRAVFLAFVVLLALGLAGGDALGARPLRRTPKLAERGPIYEFLVRNRVYFIDGRIQLAKVSAVIESRFRVRSIVKIIRREMLPGPGHLEEVRKRIRNRMRKGLPIRFNASRMPNQLDLLRKNILAGEVIEFHPSKKLGELELIFSEGQSLKIEIGYDMFYVRIGNRDCTFRSRLLRRQLKNILQPRGVR